MQHLRKLFFVAFTTIFLGFAFSSSQVAFAQVEDDVVINEFVVNPATGKEYIELLVTKPGGVNMQGWTISDVGTRAGTAGATEGDFILPAAAYLANVPQGTLVVLVLTTPAGNTNTLAEDTSTTDGNRKLVLFTTTTGVATGTGTIDISGSDNIQVYAGTRAAGTLIDQVLAGPNNNSLVAGATWGDNVAATTTDNINGSTAIPGNSAVRFVPTADTLAAYKDNDTGARFVVDANSYGTPGAPNAGIPGETTFFPPLIISEFRTFGPTGSCDEFIEIYNTSNQPYTVQSDDAGSTGFAVAYALENNGASTFNFFTIPNGTPIPARGHYLITNSGGGTACASGGSYSGGSYPAGSGTFATGNNAAPITDDIPTNAGLALFKTSNSAGFTIANRLDAVGTSAQTNPLYKEGTGYPSINPAAPNIGNHSLFRDARSGLPQDTNNNETDFRVVDTNGATICTSTVNFQCQRLGAPGPENTSSPVQRNDTIKASLVDIRCTGMRVNPTLPSACRFERDTTPGGAPATRGTITIRRRFVNTRPENVTRLRFRIVNITTFPEGQLGNGIADLRAITSATVTATCQSESGTPHICSDNSSPTTTIEGTTLEQQAFPNDQPNGGAFNSTLSLATPLGPGVGINVQFRFGVQENGFFRFFINVEALTAPISGINTDDATRSRRTSKTARAAKGSN